MSAFFIAITASAAALMIHAGISRRVLAAVAVRAGRVLAAWRTRRDRPALRKQWADALAFLGGGLKAGLTIEAAVDALTREAPEPLRSHLLERWRPDERWRPYADRVTDVLDDPRLALARAALLLARPGGGRIGRLLETASSVALRRLEAEERAEALVLPVRISAWIVGLSPVALLVSIAAISPDYIDPLFRTPTGRIVLLTATLLITMGLGLVRMLTKQR